MNKHHILINVSLFSDNEEAISILYDFMAPESGTS